MNEERYVCQCMGVSCRDIFTAVDQGARNLEQVVKITGASGNCSTCINVVYVCLQEALAGRLARREKRRHAQQVFPFMEKLSNCLK